MNADEQNLALQNAILGWQKKYGIRDGDPLLASLELFEIYLKNARLHDGTDSKPDEASPPSFGEFRESMERMDSRCKQAGKLAQELIGELRKRSSAKRSSYDGVLFVSVLFGILIVGILIGRFWT